MRTLPPWIFLFVCSQLNAQVYRWVDENGVTIYSQTPPPHAQAETVTTYQGAAPSAAEIQHRLDAETQNDDDYIEDRELAQQKKQQEQAMKAFRHNSCQTAKSNLEGLKVGGSRLMRNADGSYQRLTEEQRQTQMQQAQEQISEFCQ